MVSGWSKESYYIRAGKDAVFVKCFDTGNSAKVSSRCRINEQGRLQAVDVRSSKIALPPLESDAGTGRNVNPFGHPRVVLDQFQVAEQLLKYVVNGLSENWRSGLEMLLFAFDYCPEGGLSQVEERALRDTLERVGMSTVHLLDPARQMSESQVDSLYSSLQSGDPPATGKGSPFL